MKKTLNSREKEKLSRILKLDSEIIEKLSEHDILDTSACRAVIIRSEYQDIKSLGLSRSAIDLIIYQKEPNKKCACTRCGNPVTRYKFARYGGLCDQCLVKQVNIE